VRQREDAAIAEVLGAAAVVLATNAGAADRALRGQPPFDVVRSNFRPDFEAGLSFLSPRRVCHAP